MQDEQQILIKVDKATKLNMKKLKLNWSAEIRKFISRKLEEKRNLALAVALTYKILEGQKKSKRDSAVTIREWRDKRYGPDSA